jgi:hypothetical protein
MSSHSQISARQLPIYFNFFEATSIKITKVQLYGIIIAPSANVYIEDSVIHGAIYAKSINGKVSIKRPASNMSICLGNSYLPSVDCRTGPSSLANTGRSLLDNWIFISFIIIIYYLF